MNRRTYLGAAGCAGVAGLAGCLGLAGLDEHTANAVGVDPDAKADAGYDQTDVDDLVVEESFDLMLWTETVSVTNYVVEHEKEVSIDPIPAGERAAVFVVLSTPQISVIGQQVNPVEDMSTAELIELVADNYEDIDNVERQDDGEISLLDQDVAMSTFSADATLVGGVDFEANLHITEAVETDDDLVVAIGVYPTLAESEERSNVEALMQAVDPDVDVYADGEDGDGENGDGEDDGDD